MKNKTLYFVAFFIGAAAGVAASFKYAQKKYEQIAQEEIDSVKEAFSRKNEELSERVKEVKATQQAMADQAKNKSSVMNYAGILADKGYTNYSKPEPDESHVSNTPDLIDKPYVISPDEFGGMDEYETFSLSYYADGKVADDHDDLLDDIDEVIGLDSLTHFGEYEDDTVFVRNDRLKADYEICLDNRNYSDLINREPQIEMEV